MKANEAPEKIWIDPATDLSKLSGHIDNDSIEYVRKDAFIKKACEWQKKELCNYFDAPREDFERFIEDFKKYMEVE